MTKNTIITKELVINALTERFPRNNLAFSFREIPPTKTIPTEWKNFGINNDMKNCAWHPLTWEIYSHRLPWTHTLLRKCLIGTAILYTEQPNLIYIFHDSEDYYFYIGKPPLSYLNLHTRNKLKIPCELVDFYQNIHNGFTFHPTNAMGPLPLEDQPLLIHLYDGTDFPFPKESIGIFHNGAGDYLSVAPNIKKQNAFIWWHEHPENPDFNLDLCAVMDNWICLFLEDTQVLRS